MAPDLRLLGAETPKEFRLCMAYRFDPFELHPESRLLLPDGARIEVPKRVFDCLLLLIEQREAIPPELQKPPAGRS